ncbi:Uncharacterised protein [Mycobacteroides abscessus subsp. massiliense]|nr:Uncharacterised protein [Mycobacteroides abscessus subsp. massiliense]
MNRIANIKSVMYHQQSRPARLGMQRPGGLQVQ